jgi:hypothetical protein
MAEDAKTQSWWSTLPGILTAVAGVLTAATGLVAAIKQLGLFDHAPPPAPVVQASAAPASAAGTADKPSPAPAGNAADASNASAPTAALVGSWRDSVEAQRGPFRMVVRAEGDKLYAHVWAHCRPRPCDWGEAAASPLPEGGAQPAFTAHFTDRERETSLKFHALAADSIELDYTSKFPDGKPDFTASRVFKRGG